MSTPNGIFNSIEEHINSSCKEIIDKEKQRLNEEFNDKNAHVEALLDEIGSTKEELENKEKEMMESYNECQEILKTKEDAIARACESTSPDKYIKINIGGQIFETLKSTITSISPYFARIFSDKFADPIRDNDGNVFIDKSSIGFQAIIDWVRLGQDDFHFQKILITMQKQHNTMEYELFVKTMDYFGINHDNLTISHGQEIKIYWRGDRQMFTAKIISSPKDLPLIRVQYIGDGECWEYNCIQLKHKLGKYNNLTANRKTIERHGKPIYWHYGTDSGSIKISDMNPKPSCYEKPGESKEDDDSSDED
jgi:hypothetical protein